MDLHRGLEGSFLSLGTGVRTGVCLLRAGCVAFKIMKSDDIQTL